MISNDRFASLVIELMELGSVILYGDALAGQAAVRLRREGHPVALLPAGEPGWWRIGVSRG